MMSNNKKRAKLAADLLLYRGEGTKEPLILLRDIEGLENGSFRDLDILASRFSSNEFEHFVIERGFIVVKRVSRFHFFQYCLCEISTQEFFLLDIWTKLHFRGIAYFPKEHNLETKVLDSGVTVLAPFSSLSVSYVKCLTQSGTVKRKYLQLARDSGFTTGELTAESLLFNKTEKLFTGFWNRCAWALQLLRSIFLRRNLLVIYLLGPDGAGKTTVSDRLIAGQLRANTQYFHGRIPLLPRLNRFKTKPTPKAKFSDTVKPNFTFGHAIYYSLDSILVRLMVNLSWWKDLIIVSDRTHYDIVAREDYRNIPQLIQNTLVRSIYRPDLVLLLTCPAEEIHTRKPELSIAEIELQYEAYENHREILQFEVVNTNEDADSITQISEKLSNELSHYG